MTNTEHWSLASSVNVLDPEDPAISTVYYQYTEYGSKNNLGGIKQVRKRQSNKVVRHFANPKLGEKCLVHLLDPYFSKRPEFKPDSPDKDAFYLRPAASDSSAQWYYARPIGHNMLKGMLKAMYKQAGLNCEGISNHSLRATAATRMLNAGLPEKVIMDRTAHHSLDGLKPYTL